MFNFKLIIFICLICVHNGSKNKNRSYKNEMAEIKNYPYVAYVCKKINLLRTHACAGSILTKRWILTVAHCMNEAKEGASHKQGWIVRVGLTTVGNIDLNVDYNIPVEKYVQHPAWFPSKRINDIALLYLVRELKFNAYIQRVPIAIPNTLVKEKFKRKTFSKCVILGWKIVIPNEEMSAFYFDTKLHVHYTRVLDVAQCTQLLNTSEIVREILGKSDVNSNFQMCVYNKTSKNPCIENFDTGDSGGPLVCDGIQYGLVSWSFPCAVNTAPILTRLDKYYPWIRTNIRTYINLTNKLPEIHFLCTLSLIIIIHII